MVPHDTVHLNVEAYTGDDVADLDGSGFFSIDKGVFYYFAMGVLHSLTSDQALLPAPFLSSQRRARAFTQIQPSSISLPLSQIPNPQLSTPARVSHAQPFGFNSALLNTPPPNPYLLNKYRLRGAVTDPAQTRRRPAFGQVSLNKMIARNLS